MLIQILLFIAGIAVLYIAGMVFIHGASGTARILNIRPIITGVVIVAFATSAPEFFVSFSAALRNSQGLALGNIVGSCICNIGMVLGLSALIRPVKVNSAMLRREIPVLVLSTILLFTICMDFKISRFESIILLSGFLGFIFYCVKNAKNSPEASSKQKKIEPSKPLVVLALLAGLTGLLYGARIVVNSAVILSRYFGISELAIGLTIVAIGTSLPELFASLAASQRQEGDISVGNVIGSNIFNMLAIIGVVGFISPIIVDSIVLYFNFPILLIYTMALVPVLRTGYTISRREGMLLLLSYFVYLWLVFKI
jgi:cation:H+ antiporter